MDIILMLAVILAAVVMISGIAVLAAGIIVGSALTGVHLIRWLRGGRTAFTGSSIAARRQSAAAR